VGQYILPIISVIFLILLYLAARWATRRKAYKAAFLLYILLAVISIILLIHNLSR